MKVKIRSYPNRLRSRVYENYMNKKYGYVNWPNEHSRFENTLEWVEDRMQDVYNVFNWIWFDRRQQRVKVHIDRWDTWSMDHTLAPIILPMLVQLKETKHGAPHVDLEDVPKELHGKKLTKKQKEQGEVDDKHFERWDWVLNEMIWAFEQKCRDHWEEDYYGPYIEGEGEGDGILGGHFEWTDDEGRQKHQERMSNGFRLFGKYFESLWD
jgi:hypothetical protein